MNSYVIVCAGAVLTFDGAVLWIPTRRGVGTLFQTRAEAQRALTMTLRYAFEHGLDWAEREYNICRVRS